MFSHNLFSNDELQTELKKVMDPNYGGMGIDHVQCILQELLKENKHVYVPSHEELSGHNARLDIELLKSKNYHYIVYAQPHGKDNHQVAVIVDIRNPEITAVFYNSYPFPTDCAEFPKRQMHLLGDKIKLDEKGGPCNVQLDSWSCGIYVIANLLSSLGHTVPGKDWSGINPADLAKMWVPIYLNKSKQVDALPQVVRRNSINSSTLFKSSSDRKISEEALIKSLMNDIEEAKCSEAYAGFIVEWNGMSDEERVTYLNKLKNSVNESDEVSKKKAGDLVLVNIALGINEILKNLQEYEIILSEIGEEPFKNELCSAMIKAKDDLMNEPAFELPDAEAGEEENVEFALNAFFTLLWKASSHLSEKTANIVLMVLASASINSLSQETKNTIVESVGSFMDGLQSTNKLLQSITAPFKRK